MMSRFSDKPKIYVEINGIMIPFDQCFLNPLTNKEMQEKGLSFLCKSKVYYVGDTYVKNESKKESYYYKYQQVSNQKNHIIEH